MIKSEPLPLMTQTVANQSSYYNNNPNTRRLTLEEQYRDLSQNFINQNQQNQSQQSNPYDDYVSILNSTTDITKEKILQDDRFILVYAQCENMLKQHLYNQIIPSVLQTQQGRIMFEQLCNTTKNLKEEYAQLDIQREKEAAELEKRLSEREKSLEEKERQIDEMLKKMNTAQTAQQRPNSPLLQNHNNSNQNYYNENQYSGGGNTE